MVPRHDPESDRVDALVDRLRADSGALLGVAQVDVGGSTAAGSDFTDLVSGSMWKILLFVLVFSYLVLFVLLRSVLLPLKAVLVNLLSVGAAYGVLVAVFQWGWLDGVLGFESLGYVNAMTPPFLLAIVFGLSMDYEVFLLSRIRERYDATGDTTRAVAEGLRSSAATISSAALIMVAVFAVFAGTGTPSIKEIGVGLSVAIALDATLVRLILVPATMEIMGRWNWWLPERVARACRGPTSTAPPSRPASPRAWRAPGRREPPGQLAGQLVDRDPHLLERVAVAQGDLRSSIVAVDRHAPGRADLVLAAVTPADRAARVVLAASGCAGPRTARAPARACRRG